MLAGGSAGEGLSAAAVSECDPDSLAWTAFAGGFVVPVGSSPSSGALGVVGAVGSSASSLSAAGGSDDGVEERDEPVPDDDPDDDVEVASLVTGLVACAPVGFLSEDSLDFAEEVSESDEDDEEVDEPDDPVVSAHAGVHPYPMVTAAPMPRATASAPTRPT